MRGLVFTASLSVTIRTADVICQMSSIYVLPRRHNTNRPARATPFIRKTGKENPCFVYLGLFLGKVSSREDNRQHCQYQQNCIESGIEIHFVVNGKRRIQNKP